MFIHHGSLLRSSSTTPAPRDNSFSGIRPTERINVSQAYSFSVPGIGHMFRSTCDTATDSRGSIISRTWSKSLTIFRLSHTRDSPSGSSVSPGFADTKVPAPRRRRSAAVSKRRSISPHEHPTMVHMYWMTWIPAFFSDKMSASQLFFRPAYSSPCLIPVTASSLPYFSPHIYPVQQLKRMRNGNREIPSDLPAFQISRLFPQFLNQLFKLRYRLHTFMPHTEVK